MLIDNYNLLDIINEVKQESISIAKKNTDIKKKNAKKKEINNKNNLLELYIGDTYLDKELGEGKVVTVLEDHYEIRFPNKLKLISKWNEDLSIVEEEDKYYEKYINEKIQADNFPINVKDCLNRGNIITIGQFLATKEKRYIELSSIYEESKQQKIMAFILKQQKKYITYLRKNEVYIYQPNDEDIRLQKQRDDFREQHKDDWKNYHEELIVENGQFKYVYKKKNNLTYKLRYPLDEEMVYYHFMKMIKLETLTECIKYKNSILNDNYDYFNADKAIYLLHIGKEMHERKHYSIQQALQRKLRNIPKIILKNIKSQKDDNDMLTDYIDFLSCNLKEFKERFELLFKEKMNWHNYGKWHIDHIKPCNYFDLLIAEQQIECFKLSNLQPLWASENQRKFTDYKSNNIVNFKNTIEYCLFDKSLSMDEYFIKLNEMFEKEHPPMYYEYV